MDDFIDEVQTLITEYGYDDVKRLCVSLAIETFKGIRNYPKTYPDGDILEDLRDNKSKIAYAAIEIDAKIGIEGQTGHNENGLNRTFGQLCTPKAFATVIPFAVII